MFELVGQGYTRTEAARMLDISPTRGARLLKRVNDRTAATNVDHYRTVQLLSLERLKQACLSVLEANHVVVSNGHIVHEYVLDSDGKPIWDPVYGPDGEQVVDDQGNLLVEQRRAPLADHGAVLEAARELRKIEDSIMKLLGTATPVKQTVEVQQVDYVIKGVDLSKTLGLNLVQNNDK